MFRWVVVGLVAVAGCGGEPAPDGYERWSGSDATFVYPEDSEQQDLAAEFKEAGTRFLAGAGDSADLMLLEDKGKSLDAFMAESFGPAWQGYDLSLGPRQRIDVPGAREASRREATYDDNILTIVFASREAEHHLALVVGTTRAAAGDVDVAAILRSLALD